MSKTDQQDAADRDAAIERGRLMGTLEADSRREKDPARGQRIKRAMAYAAWEYDEKPRDIGSAPTPGTAQRYRKEFGLGDPPVIPSLDRTRPK